MIVFLSVFCLNPINTTAIGIRCTLSLELFWNSLDNAHSSIVFYMEIKMEVEVGVHDIRSRFTPRLILRENRNQ